MTWKTYNEYDKERKWFCSRTRVFLRAVKDHVWKLNFKIQEVFGYYPFWSKWKTYQ